MLSYRGKLKQRRFLVMRGLQKNHFLDPMMIWIDDDDSCTLDRESHLDKFGNPHNPLFHRYELKNKQIYAIRCPQSVTDDEKWRVLVDWPEGSAISKFNEFIKTHGRHPSTKSEKHKIDASDFD